MVSFILLLLFYYHLKGRDNQKSDLHLLQCHSLPTLLLPKPNNPVDTTLPIIDALEVSDDEQYRHLITGI